MNPLIAALVVYYAISLTVGFWKTRKQNAAEYIAEKNRLNVFVLCATLVGTTVGGGMFLGIAQLGFEKPLTAIALGVAYLVGSVVVGLLAPSLRRYMSGRNLRTLFGLFDSLYPSTRMSSVSNLFMGATFVVFLLMLSVQFIAMISFLSYYSTIHFNILLLVGATSFAVLSTFIYSLVGGFKRDVYTDVVQVLFIVLGLVIVMLKMLNVGSLQAKLSSLPFDVFKLGAGDTVLFIGALLFVAPTFLVRFDLWQRIIAAKSDSHARSAFILSGIFSFIFFIAFGLLGLYARTAGLVNSEFVGLGVISKLVTGWQHGLAMAAFFAAVISSADTFLGVAGLALAKGVVYRKNELEAATEGEVSVKKLRLVTLGAGLASILVAFVIRDIVSIFASAFGILMVFLPALVGGLFRSYPGELEARWSIIGGLVVVISLTLSFPSEAFLPGIVVSTLIYVFIAKKGQREAPPRASDGLS
jgi:solute:Na+ symporter, SSS family